MSGVYCISKGNTHSCVQTAFIVVADIYDVCDKSGAKMKSIVMEYYDFYDFEGGYRSRKTRKITLPYSIQYPRQNLEVSQECGLSKVLRKTTRK